MSSTTIIYVSGVPCLDRRVRLSSVPATRYAQARRAAQSIDSHMRSLNRHDIDRETCRAQYTRWVGIMRDAHEVVLGRASSFDEAMMTRMAQARTNARRTI